SLPPMPLDRLSKLVERPAAVTGLSVERGLADVIARDIGSAEALPLLAHTLWLPHRQGESKKRLSLADYHSLGDPERRLNPVENSIRVVAERSLAGTKDSALLTQSRFLADLVAQETANGDACTGMLLAIEALPSAECGKDRPYCSEAELALFSATQCRFQEYRILAGHEGKVWGAALSPDRLHLLTASEDGTVRLWSLETGEAIAILRGHTAATLSVAFDADGQSAGSAAEDGTARIWDLSSCKERVVLRGHDGWVWNASFSPDGDYVVTSLDDNTARLWDAKNGSAVFNSNGCTVATSSADETGRIWNAETGQSIGVLRG